jgi:serine/threonine protein kinase
LQELGICHRDLSLENILVDVETCLVIDMGMCLRVPYNDPARQGGIIDVHRGALRRLIKPQGVCGKHNYMSPEVFENTKPFDGFAIDLWAAGAILYIMLTGFPGYDQASRADKRFDLIVNGNLTKQLEEWQIHLSADAGELLQSMMQLDPRDRLTLAEVMAHPCPFKIHVIRYDLMWITCLSRCSVKILMIDHRLIKTVNCVLSIFPKREP